MEIPDSANPEYMMYFKKFAQSVKGLIFNEEKVFIKGKFKQEGSNEVFSKDDFLANEVHESGKSINAELIYKTYLEWFNRTLKPHETKRIFVSAEFGLEVKQE